ncbi:hypothetical protein [Mesorhizobium loti]|nr:hypothetical protein [Mesorhizobium loti]
MADALKAETEKVRETIVKLMEEAATGRTASVVLMSGEASDPAL